MKAYIEDTWEKIFGLRRCKRIFIAATHQNVGKTTVSLGLIFALTKIFKNIGFIKPVGQRYVIEGGSRVDEDTVLIDEIFGFEDDLQKMSPVTVGKGYTERFLDGKGEGNPSEEIISAFNSISSNKDVVVIEGTGHAGVGSVFDLSNATVARMLSSKVILVAPGGIGNPIDEIMLNKALFDAQGVKLQGVIINKVRLDKFDKVNEYVRKGLERLGVPVLGVMPYMDLLEIPTLSDIKEELSMEVLCCEEYLHRQMKKIFVGAMDVREVAQHLENDCFVITPGNRKDLLALLVKLHTGGRFISSKNIAGIIISGGLRPKKRLLHALKKAGIPVLLSKLNTYDVAAKVHDLTVKIKYRDKDKVKLAMEIVSKYVNMEGIINNLN